MHTTTRAPGKSRRATVEVAEVFRRFGADYRRRYAPGEQVCRVMWAIENCRTSKLGGHIDRCSKCGGGQPAYNSCRNRCCPKCQALAQAAWLEGRKRRLIPTHYFHVVFTLPSELREIARLNPRTMFDLLFATATSTLLELARDPKHLGALPGITAVLHTWTRTLAYHPHLHCVVTGGGLSLDGQHWVRGHRSHLFPVRVMSALFRGKLLAGVRRLIRKNALRIPTPLKATDTLDALIDCLYRKDWVVYAKRPFVGVERVYEYLGRYTHRVGISNQRLRTIDENGVTFATKNGNVTTLAHVEFIRRFLQHVLPPEYTKIRHYGLLAPSNANSRLVDARRLLGAEPIEQPEDHTWRDRLFELTGIDLRICRHCGEAAVIRSMMLTPPRFPDVDREEAYDSS